MAAPGRERRQSFRIEDKVTLQVRIMEQAEYEQALKTPRDDQDAASLVSQMRALTVQAGNVLVSIRKTNPDIAQYLTLIERKIDMLARQIEGARAGDDTSVTTRVSLSSGGMGYVNDTPLAMDTKLDVRLVIFPSYLRVHALARVVHCEPDTTTPERWRIGVEFTRVSDTEQEALVRHLLERQSEQLRRQRGR